MAPRRQRRLAPGSAYVVTAGCVVARDAAGGQGYFYEGVALPDTVPVEEKERLVETGLVEVRDSVVVVDDEEPATSSDD